MRITNAAAAMVTGDAGPVTAILRCYKPYHNTKTFDDADAGTQERFLREYADTSLKAATHLNGTQAESFYAEAIDISDRYSDWYDLLSPAEQAQVGRTRFSQVVDGELTAYLALQQQKDALTFLEQLASTHAQLLESRLLKKWMRLLQGYPDFRISYSPIQIRHFYRTNRDVKARWEEFRKAVRLFSKAPRMKNVGEEFLSQIDALLQT